MKNLYLKIILCNVTALALSSNLMALDQTKLLEQIRGNAKQYSEFKALLNSPEQNVRISAFESMVNSGDASLRDIAIDEALASIDSTLQSIALREVVLNLETINFKLDEPDKLSEEAKKVLEKWGNNYNVTIKKVDKEAGKIVKGRTSNYHMNLIAVVSGIRFSWNAGNYCFGDTKLENGNELVGTLKCSKPQLLPVKIRTKLR